MSFSPARSNGRRASIAGFTIYELIVVIVILSILAVVVVPSMTQAGSSRSLSAARQVAADLEYAQNRAISIGDGVRVTFGDPTAHAYSLYNASAAEKHPITNADYTVSFASDGYLKGTRLTTSLKDEDGAETQTIWYDALGAPALSEAGVITVEYDAYQYTVEVAPITGQVTVETGP